MEQVLDWIWREGNIFLTWWLMASIAGWTIMPLAYRLLGGLPDRGYAFSKALGLMLIGFVYWLLVSLGLLGNTSGGVIAAWLIVLVLSMLAWWRVPGEMPSWKAYWRENRSVILLTELLFFVLFFTWFFYRAHNPDTASTEKPMELAFISGIMRSDTFPPNDPWLAGYAISYYYFGYVIAAMLSMLSEVSSSIGFSTMFSMLFALVGVGTFGVGYNLVRSRTIANTLNDFAENTTSRFKAIATGLLALFCVLLMGNFEAPLIQVPYQANAATREYLNFWGQPRSSFANLDERQYSYDPNASLITDVSTWDHWWWFGSARVLGDYSLDGTELSEPITEFPAFSFVLGDTHPHVLSLPFVIMTLGLALNLLLTWRAPNRYEILLYGLVVGGLIFMNTWDGPIYLAALVGTDALRRIMRGQGRLQMADWWALIMFGLTLLAIAVIAYLPFLIGFRSQASGLLPNLIHPTYFPRMFLAMGPPLILSAVFVLLEVWRGRRRMNWRLGITIGLGLLGILILIMLLLTLLSSFNPALYGRVQGFVNEYGGWAEVLPLFLGRRLGHGLTSIILLLFIMAVIARLFPRHPKMTAISGTATDNEIIVTYAPATGFALLMVGIGATLLFVPDFVFLGDVFASRINTTFKFYYQAWVTLSLAGAYGAYMLLADTHLSRPILPVRMAYGVLLAAIIGLGAIFPLAATYSRAYVETGGAPNLSVDGGHLNLTSDNVQMVQCLADLVGDRDDVVVAEAALHTYRSNYGRVGTITGIPIVLGWPGHERQWRGPTYNETAGSRQSDLERLYTTPIWDVAQEIVDKYNINYIVLGSTERITYEQRDGAFVPLSEDLFAANATLVCDYGIERVYQVTPSTSD